MSDQIRTIWLGSWWACTDSCMVFNFWYLLTDFSEWLSIGWKGVPSVLWFSCYVYFGKGDWEV